MTQKKLSMFDRSLLGPAVADASQNWIRACNGAIR